MTCHGFRKPSLYGGTQVDLLGIKASVAPRSEQERPCRDATVLAFADLPFSFAFDTVLLPVTLPLAIIDPECRHPWSEKPPANTDMPPATDATLPPSS
jgi:uncharacterized protein YceK